MVSLFLECGLAKSRIVPAKGTLLLLSAVLTLFFLPTIASRAAAGKPLKPEELDTRARNMFREYASVADATDALQTARELADSNTPQCLSKMVEFGLEELMNALKVSSRSVSMKSMITLTQATVQ